MDEGAYAARVVGGLLLGAALVALVQLAAPVGALQPALALALAAAVFVASRLAERTRRGDDAGEPIAEAGFAAALVAAGSVPFFADAPAGLGALGAALVVALTLARGGRTPLALLAVPAFFVDARHATGAPMLRGADALSESALFLALLAYALLLARQSAPSRPKPQSGPGPEPTIPRWAAHALALHGLAFAVATLPLLDALGVTDPGLAALGVVATMSILFALALQLDARPLAAVCGATLGIAAAALAFLALGPALAAMVLLLLGAALVWKAEHVRVYLRSRAPDGVR